MSKTERRWRLQDKQDTLKKAIRNERMSDHLKKELLTKLALNTR